MHPLTDLTVFSIEQLELRISNLTRTYFASSNQNIKAQVELLLQEAKEEIKLRKAREQLEKENNPDSGDSELDNLIKIS